MAQIEALPKDALASLAEVRVVLELNPWGGPPLHRRNPDASIRVRTFGQEGQGLVVYLILEDQRRVEILRVTWLD
ncbi:hypothetical protein D5H75_07490 [Bailinhaonella thermotolerans]|uniref:Type II toxin-antitoxin system RelE/ParE family toxin n=1 Tax=Bailinhaonella thermotolerans TaxID=1070861 RepID=A0A3A4B1F0_9ACTN|nr:hypothetical protein D5H75_07490 [Bailinhaonella thermotolerans]